MKRNTLLSNSFLELRLNVQHEWIAMITLELLKKLLKLRASLHDSRIKYTTVYAIKLLYLRGSHRVKQ